MIIDREKFNIALATQKETLEGISRKAGVTKKTICNMKKGKNVAPRTIGMVAEALSVSVAGLLKEDRAEI
jgi:DNA-binding Xre family transcriptional regulator